MKQDIGKRLGCAVLAAQMLLAPVAEAAPSLREELELSRQSQVATVVRSATELRRARLVWMQSGVDDTAMAQDTTEENATPAVTDPAPTADLITTDVLPEMEPAPISIDASENETPAPTEEPEETISPESTPEVAPAPVTEPASTEESTSDDDFISNETTSAAIAELTDEPLEENSDEGYDLTGDETASTPESVDAPEDGETASTIGATLEDGAESVGETDSVEEENGENPLPDDGEETTGTDSFDAKETTNATIRRLNLKGSPIQLFNADATSVGWVYADFGFGSEYGYSGSYGTEYNFEGDSWITQRASSYTAEIEGMPKAAFFEEFDNSNLFSWGSLTARGNQFPRLPNLSFTNEWYAVDVNYFPKGSETAYFDDMLEGDFSPLRGISFVTELYPDKAIGDYAKEKVDFTESIDAYAKWSDAGGDLLLLARWAKSKDARATEFALYNAADSSELTLYQTTGSTVDTMAAETFDVLTDLTKNTAGFVSSTEEYFARVPVSVDELTFDMTTFEPGSNLSISVTYGGKETASYTTWNRVSKTVEGEIDKIQRQGSDYSESITTVQSSVALLCTETRTFDSGVPQNAAGVNAARGKWTFNPEYKVGENEVKLTIPLQEAGAAANQKYNVVTFTVTAPDGATTKDYVVYVQQLREPTMDLNPGNTPYGMIEGESWTNAEKETAKGAFLGADRQNRSLASVSETFSVNNGYVYRQPYFEYAWGPTEGRYDGDTDDEAIVVYQNSAFLVPGYTVYDSIKKTNVDLSSGVTWSMTVQTVDTLGPDIFRAGAGSTPLTLTREENETAEGYVSLVGLNIRPGIYEMKYTYTDPYEDPGELGTENRHSDKVRGFTRTVIVLPLRGDVDMDGAVTVADGILLQALLAEAGDTAFFKDVLDLSSTDKGKYLYTYRVCDVDGLRATGYTAANADDVTKLLNGYFPWLQSNSGSSRHSDYFYIPLADNTARTTVKATGDTSATPELQLKYLGKGTDPSSLSTGGVNYDPDANEVFWVEVQLKNAGSLPADLKNDLSSLTLTLTYDSDYVTPYMTGSDWFDYIVSQNSRWSGWTAGEVGQALLPVEERLTEGKAQADPTRALTDLKQTNAKKRLELRFSITPGEGATAQKLTDLDGSLLKVPFTLNDFPAGETAYPFVEVTLGMRDFTLTTTDGSTVYGAAWNNGSKNADDAVNTPLSSVTTNLASVFKYGGSQEIPLGADNSPVYTIKMATGVADTGWSADGNAVYGTKMQSQSFGTNPKNETKRLPTFGENATITIDGRLPNGVTYFRGGYLQGTPQEVGDFVFSVKDSSNVLQGPFLLRVEKAPLTLTVGSLPTNAPATGDVTIGQVWQYYGETKSTTLTYTFNKSDIKTGTGLDSAPEDNRAETLAALLADKGYSAPTFRLVTDADTKTPVSSDTVPGDYVVLMEDGSSTNYRFVYTQFDGSNSSDYGTAKLTILPRPVRIQKITKTPVDTIVENERFLDRTNLEADYLGSASNKNEFTFADLTGEIDANDYYNGKAPLTKDKTKAVVGSDTLRLRFTASIQRQGADTVAGFALTQNTEDREAWTSNLALPAGAANNSYYVLEETAQPEDKVSVAHVTKLKMTEITVERSPSKMTYTYGEELSLEKLVIKTRFSNSTDEGQAADTVENCEDLGLTLQWVDKDKDVPADKTTNLVVDHEQLTVPEHSGSRGRYICVTGTGSDPVRVWIGPFTVNKKALTLTLEPVDWKTGLSSTNLTLYGRSRYYGESIDDWVVQYNYDELATWDQSAVTRTTGSPVSDLVSAGIIKAGTVKIEPKAARDLKSTDVVETTAVGRYYALISGAESDNYSFQYTRAEIDEAATNELEVTDVDYVGTATRVSQTTTTDPEFGYVPLTIYPRPILVTAITAKAGSLYHNSTTNVIDPARAVKSDTSNGFTAALPDIYNLNLNPEAQVDKIYITKSGESTPSYKAILPLSEDPVHGGDTVVAAYQATFAVDYPDHPGAYWNMTGVEHKDVDVTVTNLHLDKSAGQTGNYVLLFPPDAVNAALSGWAVTDADKTVKDSISKAEDGYGGSVDLRKIVELRVDSGPDILEYTYGDTLSLGGLQVVVKYDKDDNEYLVPYYNKTSLQNTPTNSFEELGLTITWGTSGSGKAATDGQALSVAEHNRQVLVVTAPLYLGQTTAISQTVEDEILVKKKDLTLVVQPQERFYGQDNRTYEFRFNAADLTTADAARLRSAGLFQSGKLTPDAITDVEYGVGTAAVLGEPATSAAMAKLNEGYELAPKDEYVGPVFLTTADSTSNASITPYTLSLSGGNLANYDLKFVSSGITVNRRPIRLTAVLKNPIYTVSQDAISRSDGFTATTTVSSDGTFVDPKDNITKPEITIAAGTDPGVNWTDGNALVNGDNVSINLTVHYAHRDSSMIGQYDTNVYEKEYQVEVTEARLASGGANDNYRLTLVATPTPAVGKIHRREISSIEIVQRPNNLHYMYGQNLSLDGMLIRIYYVQPGNNIELQPDTVKPEEFDGIYVSYVDDYADLPAPSELARVTDGGVGYGPSIDIANSPTDLVPGRRAKTGDHLTRAVDDSGFAHHEKYLMVSAQIAYRQGFVDPVATDDTRQPLRVLVDALPLTFELEAEDKDYDLTDEARGTITLTNVYGTDKVWVKNGTDYTDLALPEGYVFHSSNYDDYGTEAWAEHYGSAEDGVKFTFDRPDGPNVRWAEVSHDFYDTVLDIPVTVTNIELDGRDKANYSIPNGVTTGVAVPTATIRPIHREAPDMDIELVVDDHTNTVTVVTEKTVDDFRVEGDEKDGELHFEYALLYLGEAEDGEGGTTTVLRKTAYQDSPYFGGEGVTVDTPDYVGRTNPAQAPEGTGAGQNPVEGDTVEDLFTRSELPRGTFFGAVVRLAQTNNYDVSDGTASVKDADGNRITVAESGLNSGNTTLVTALADTAEAMAAQYAAIEQPEKETEHRVERKAGPMVKTYTNRVELVSISDEKDTEGAEVLVPKLEAVWFTDFDLFEDVKKMDRLVCNYDPIIYCDYYWDSNETEKVEFGEEFDLSTYPNRSVQFYVPLRRPELLDMDIDLVVDDHTNTVTVRHTKTVEEYLGGNDRDSELHFEYALIYLEEVDDGEGGTTTVLRRTPYQYSPYFGGERVEVEVPEYVPDDKPKEIPEGTGGGQDPVEGDTVEALSARDALPRGAIYGAMVRMAWTNYYSVFDGTASVKDAEGNRIMIPESKFNNENTTLIDALQRATADMTARYEAIEQPEKDTEHRIEREPGPMVKTYTYRIDLVSIEEEKNAEEDKVLVPTLEAVWFTDFNTFEDDKEMDRLVNNSDPTIYYGYYWDPKETVKVDFGEKFDMAGEIWAKLPEDDDEDGAPTDADINEDGETLMNANGTVRFYVPLRNRGGSAIFMPESIELDITELEGHVGDDPVELTYTITPLYVTDKRVTWSSSDERVATVTSKGVVTFVGVGTAEITVTTWNGKSATMTVTVLRDINVPYMDTMFNVLYEGSYMDVNGEGLFEPERQVTRKELMTIMAHFFQFVDGVEQGTLRDFIDVNQRAAYMDDVELLERYGIVEGVGHDKFAPDQLATRAEISTMICRMLMLPVGDDPNAPHAFVDATPEKHWAWAYIDALAAAGLTKGTGHDEYQPERILTRAEVATFISRILATRLDMTTGSLVIPADVEMGHWAFGSILHAVNGGTMLLYGE